MSGENRCVCCGMVIPEGLQVCPICESGKIESKPDRIGVDKKMKAYQIEDREGYAEYSCVIFAECRGKAISLALGTDEFPQSDWDFTQLKARRIPSLDKYYRKGHWYMDWYNNEDKIALVKEAGYQCDDDSFDPVGCSKCCAKDFCSKYEVYMD